MDIRIRQALCKAGFGTAADLARHLEVDKSYLSAILSGARLARRLRADIAAALEVPEEKLWPPRKKAKP